MNREILFRGKRINNGEWVEGYFLETENPVYRAFIISSIDIDVHSCGMDILDSRIFEVIPETVGRYTGLTDKNGKKIFEGDIVKYNHIASNEKDVYGVIEYRNTYDQYRSHNPCGFIINWQDTPTGRVLREDLPFWCDSMSNAEVISNMYDNPDLLEWRHKVI